VIHHREYHKSLYASSYHRSETFEDVGILPPPGATGEVATTCPRCSHTRKKSRDKCLSVNVTTGLWYCHHCGWKGGLRRHDNLLPRLARRASRKPAAPQNVQMSPADEAKALARAASNRKYLIATWREAQPITPDDPAGLYLKRRGLWQTPIPTVLRYHPALSYFYDEHEHRRPTIHPCLIAAIQGPNDLVISVHRIYLGYVWSSCNLLQGNEFMSIT